MNKMRSFGRILLFIFSLLISAKNRTMADCNRYIVDELSSV